MESGGFSGDFSNQKVGCLRRVRLGQFTLSHHRAVGRGNRSFCTARHALMKEVSLRHYNIKILVFRPIVAAINSATALRNTERLNEDMGTRYLFNFADWISNTSLFHPSLAGCGWSQEGDSCSEVVWGSDSSHSLATSARFLWKKRHLFW